MKNLFYFILILFPHILFAQLSPQWQTTIYFEDAIGNRDSIVIGHDSLATEKADAEFGEWINTDPVEENFTLRAVDMLNLSFAVHEENIELQTERVIMGNEPLFLNGLDSILCYTTLGTVFFIQSTHQPITISWRPSDFLRDNCVVGDYWITDPTLLFINPLIYWAEFDPNLSCMSSDSNFSVYLGKEYIEDNPGDFISTVVNNTDGSRDTLYGLYLMMGDNTGFSGCPNFTVSTQNLLPGESTSFQVYPNPVSSELTLVQKQPFAMTDVQISIYTLPGKLLLSKNVDMSYTQYVNTSEWSPGMYYVRITDGEGRQEVLKVLKM